MESIDASIGQRIFDLRVERDVQQGELARAVGLHQSVLNRIEKGTRPAKAAEIRELALTFDVSADMLLCLAPLATQSEPETTATSVTDDINASTLAPITASNYITVTAPALHVAEARRSYPESSAVTPPPVAPLFSTTESELIERFRRLDARGRDTILRAIENELQYSATATEFPAAER